MACVGKRLDLEAAVHQQVADEEEKLFKRDMVANHVQQMDAGAKPDPWKGGPKSFSFVAQQKKDQAEQEAAEAAADAEAVEAAEKDGALKKAPRVMRLKNSKLKVGGMMPWECEGEKLIPWGSTYSSNPGSVPFWKLLKVAGKWYYPPKEEFADALEGLMARDAQLPYEQFVFTRVKTMFMEVFPENLRIRGWGSQVENLRMMAFYAIMTFRTIATVMSNERFVLEDESDQPLVTYFIFQKAVHHVWHAMSTGVIKCPWKPGIVDMLKGARLVPVNLEEFAEDAKSFPAVPPERKDGETGGEEDEPRMVPSRCVEELCEYVPTWMDALWNTPLSVMKVAGVRLYSLFIFPFAYVASGFSQKRAFLIGKAMVIVTAAAAVLWGLYKAVSYMFRGDEGDEIIEDMEELKRHWIENPNDEEVQSDPRAVEYLREVGAFAQGDLEESGGNRDPHAKALREQWKYDRTSRPSSKAKGKKKSYGRGTKQAGATRQMHNSSTQNLGLPREEASEVEIITQAALQTRTVVDNISENFVYCSIGGAGLSGTFIRGDQLLIPYHFFRNVQTGELHPKGTVIIIRQGLKDTFVEFDPACLSQVDSLPQKNGKMIYDDWVIYRCGKGYAFKDITEHFLQTVTPDLGRTYTMYLFARSTRDKAVAYTELPEIGMERNRLRYRSYLNGEFTSYVPEQLIYQPMDYGDCGGLVMGIKPGGEVAILGMHVAQRSYDGEESFGVARPFHSGMVLEAKGNNSIAQAENDTQPDPRLKLIGPVPLKIPPAPFTTDLVRGPLHGDPYFAHVDRSPAHLGYSPTCPYSQTELKWKELHRCNYDEYLYPEDDVESIFMEGIFQHFDKVWKDGSERYARIATVDEMLNGGGVFTHIRAICITTSGGYPTVTLPGSVGKRLLIEGVAGKYVLTPYGQEMYERKLRHLKLPERKYKEQPEIAILYCKDELRSKSKIDKFQTRLITCFDAVYTFVCRQYFMGFVQEVHSKFNAGLSSAVGMNVYSADWDTMIKYLRQYNDVGFCGDYVKFESLLTPQLAEAMIRMINKWYQKHDLTWKEEDDVVRFRLMRTMLRSWLVVDGQLWEQLWNLKSGVFGTTAMYGNLLGMFFMRWAFMVLARRNAPKICGPTRFDDYVRLKVFSDDNIVVPTPSVAEWFNHHTVTEVLATAGVGYTPADKDAISCDPLTPIADLQFLACKSRHDNEYYPLIPGIEFYAQPMMDSRFFSSAVWITCKISASRATLDNLNHMLLRAWGCDRKVFEEMRDQFVHCMNMIGIRGSLWSWSDLYMSFGTAEDEALDESSCGFYTWGHFECKRTKDYRLVGMIPKDRTRKIPWVKLPKNTSVQQMDSGASLVDLESAGAKSTIQPGANVANPVVEDGFGRSFSYHSLMKRMGVWQQTLDDGAQQVPLAELLIRTPPNTKGCVSHLHYFSQFARYYRGGMTVYIRSKKQLHATYDMTGEGITADQTQSPDGLRQTGVGPNITSIGGDVHNVVLCPWFSQYVMTEVPRVFAETITSRSAVGKFYYSLAEADAAGAIFAAGADDFRLGFFMELPKVVLPVPPPVKRKNRSVAQSDVGGVTFEAGGDPHVVVTGGPRQGMPNVSDAGLIERQMDLANLMMRKQYLADFTWQVSDDVADVVFEAVVPWDLVLADSVGEIPLSNMTFFRYSDVLITVKIQSQSFQVGCLIMFFVPGRDTTYIDVHIGQSRTNISILPHILVQAGSNGEYTFRVPWVSIQPMFNTTESENNGTLRMQVFNSLLVGADSPTQCTGTIWVEFTKPIFQVIRPRLLTYTHDLHEWTEEEKDNFSLAQGMWVTDPHSLASFYTLAQDHLAEIDARKALAALEDDEPNNKSCAQGQVMSAVTTAANVVAVAQESITFAKKMKKRIGGDELDRPFVAANPPFLLNAGGPALSELSVVDMGRYMGDIPSDESLPSQQEFCSKVDEFTIGNFVERASFIETVIYSSSTAAGTILHNVAMSCVPEFFSATLGSPIQLTSCGAGSLPFTYWRCSGFKLRVQVVSCGGQGGQLSVIPAYGYSSTVPFNEAMSSYSLNIDVSTSKSHEVVIPWHSTKEWLRVPHTSYSGPEFTEFAFGMLQIVALSPLIATGAVPNSCYLNLSISLDNPVFRFANNGMTNIHVFDPYVTPEVGNTPWTKANYKRARGSTRMGVPPRERKMKGKTVALFKQKLSLQG